MKPKHIYCICFQKNTKARITCERHRYENTLLYQTELEITAGEGYHHRKAEQVENHRQQYDAQGYQEPYVVPAISCNFIYHYSRAFITLQVLNNSSSPPKKRVLCSPIHLPQPGLRFFQGVIQAVVHNGGSMRGLVAQ